MTVAGILATLDGFLKFFQEDLSEARERLTDARQDHCRDTLRRRYIKSPCRSYKVM